ncbi:hypothetical protein U3516DRAFT_792787 [Neocallimastix sp. 'constans']
MKWEIKYTILNDYKDVHFSLKLDHKINYSNTQFSDIHLILRIKSNTFSWLQVDDDAGRYLLTTEQQKNCQVIGPKETCKVKTGTSVLRVSIVANSSTALSISFNGRKSSTEVANFKDDSCIRQNGILEFYRELEFKLGTNNFKIEENKITLHANIKPIPSLNELYFRDSYGYYSISTDSFESVNINEENSIEISYNSFYNCESYNRDRYNS